MSGGRIRGSWFRIILPVVLLLASCQTAQEKSVYIVKDRVEKLRPLSKWSRSWCQVETHLTQPAIARYRQMFPSEVDKILLSGWTYTWRASEASCELKPSVESPAVKNHMSFMQDAFCMLLQVHFVNSPFDSLSVPASNFVMEEGKAHIIASGDPHLGIFLDPTNFVVETRTKSRGVLSAMYSQHEGEWLPSRLAQDMASYHLILDEIEYADVKISGRRQIKSFWISVGAEQPLKHTQVVLNNCQKD